MSQQSNTAPWIIALVLIFGLGFMTAASYLTENESHKPLEYTVTNQYGFLIDVNNDIMQRACVFHNIGPDDIRWDIENKTFSFYRKNGEHCKVFTNAFMKELSKENYVLG